MHFGVPPCFGRWDYRAPSAGGSSAVPAAGSSSPRPEANPGIEAHNGKLIGGGC